MEEVRCKLSRKKQVCRQSRVIYFTITCSLPNLKLISSVFLTCVFARCKRVYARSWVLHAALQLGFYSLPGVFFLLLHRRDWRSADLVYGGSLFPTTNHWKLRSTYKLAREHVRRSFNKNRAELTFSIILCRRDTRRENFMISKTANVERKTVDPTGVPEDACSWNPVHEICSR